MQAETFYHVEKLLLIGFCSLLLLLLMYYRCRCSSCISMSLYVVTVGFLWLKTLLHIYRRLKTICCLFVFLFLLSTKTSTMPKDVATTRKSLPKLLHVRILRFS